MSHQPDDFAGHKDALAMFFVVVVGDPYTSYALLHLRCACMELFLCDKTSLQASQKSFLLKVSFKHSFGNSFKPIIR